VTAQESIPSSFVNLLQQDKLQFPAALLLLWSRFLHDEHVNVHLVKLQPKQVSANCLRDRRKT